ncbi:hypothetical protein [Streptomyces sp. NPDC006739]|uniref:hypothetical protein n=1 Tax=Streptomyces sp. NPDC006739 TaxID=3364763 RepID=UPI0036BEF367
MTTETLPTASLPAPSPGPSWLPRPGTYTAGPGRHITELAGRLGPLTTSRSRLTAEDATLTVAADPEDCVLRWRLTGRPLRGTALTFVSRNLVPEADGTRIRASGELAALPGRPTPATLVLRVVDRADDQLLVLGTIRLPYGPLRRTTGLTLPRTRPADRIRLLVAAEFTCPA